MPSHGHIRIREATPRDIPDILKWIQELAHYEKAGDEAILTPDDLLRDGFDEHPLFGVLLAEYEGEAAGMAFWYTSYSTWKGKCLYLEDLYVKEDLRRKGIGKLLFEAMIKKANEEGYARLQWQVLNWNAPALAFYQKYHTAFSPEWLNCTLHKKDLPSPVKNPSNLNA